MVHGRIMGSDSTYVDVCCIQSRPLTCPSYQEVLLAIFLRCVETVIRRNREMKVPQIVMEPQERTENKAEQLPIPRTISGSSSRGFHPCGHREGPQGPHREAGDRAAGEGWKLQCSPMCVCGQAQGFLRSLTQATSPMCV